VLGYGTERELKSETARQEVRQPFHDLLAVVEYAPTAQLLLAPNHPDFTILAASREYLELTGIGREDLIGKSLADVIPDDGGTSSDLTASLSRALASQGANAIQIQFQQRAWRVRNTPIPAEDGTTAWILHSLEQPRQRDYDACLVRLDDLTRPLVDPGEIVAHAARVLGEQLDVDRCSYGTYLPDQSFARLNLQYIRPGAPAIESGLYQISSFGPFVREALLADLPVIIRDSETDQNTVEHIETYRRFHIRAHVCVPLHKEGRLVASMTVTDSTRPRNWLPEEVALVRSVASRCWESLERLRVTSELRASEQRRHLAQRAAGIGSFEYILKDDRIIWSPELRSLYGLQEAAFEGTLGEWSKLVEPGDAGRVINFIQNAAARHDTECTYEFRAILPDGTRRWLRARSQLFYDQSGAPERMLGVNIDISNQKTAQADLEASLERLQQQWHTFDTALSNSPDLTYTFDPEGRFTYANKKLCEVSQRTLQDTVGKTPAELGYPPELARRIAEQIARVIETKQGIRDQTAFRLRTGEVREYEYLYAPVIGESGHVEAIAGATRDVTERKEAEEQLRKSEMQFRQLFDSLPQLVWSATPQGFEDLYNKQWFEYTGLAEKDLTGDGSKIIHPDDLPLAAERWNHSLATGEPYEIEYRCRRHDGDYRWFLGRANPVLDSEGHVVRWFGTCTDIHDKKESENALLKAHRQQEEFSYVASHDLQEPLRMVNIYSQLLLKQVDATQGNIGLYTGFIQQGVKRMETLINDLLSFSRITQSEAESMERGAGQTADLTAALEEARAVLSARIQENNALISAPALPTARGDTQQIAHVFQNLISNSLKYRKADCRPEIKVTVRSEEKEWIVSFEDNGIGFEPRYAERIFGLFKRLHKDEYPGTGLGLAICQRIAERYGGRIWAEGKPGLGATFHLALQKA
jgi:PAS domain S-box-containing protein